MTEKEYSEFVATQTIVHQSFFDEGYKFWFVDNENMRSPFPVQIQEKLRDNSYKTFMEWLFELTVEEKEKLTDDELVEMFEMFMFNEGIKMVETDDQRITICYPFMIRMGDQVDDKKEGLSEVVSRVVREEKKDEKKYLNVKLKTLSEEKMWETEFELPA